MRMIKTIINGKKASEPAFKVGDLICATLVNGLVMMVTEARVGYVDAVVLHPPNTSFIRGDLMKSCEIAKVYHFYGDFTFQCS